MQKLFFILGLFLCAVYTQSVFSEVLVPYELKIKSQKPQTVYNASINKNDIMYFDKVQNKYMTIRYDDSLEYLKRLDKGGFKKTIILTNKKYYTGTIIYQDRSKLSIEIDNNLASFKNEDITNIISEDDFLAEKARSRYKAAGLSMLFPGAGQFYSNRYGTATLFGSGFLLMSVASVYSYYSADASWAKYEKSNYKSKAQYETYKNKMYICYTTSIAAGVIYIASIAEAFFNFKYKYDALNAQAFQESGETTFSLVQTEKNHVYACLTYSF